MSVLKISSTIVGSEVNGYYASRGFVRTQYSDPNRRRQLVWESDNELRLEADDETLLHARIIRGRSTVAECQTSHWDVWDGTDWKRDKEFRVLHHLRPKPASQVKLPIIQYQGSSVFFLAFSVRPLLMEESIAMALDVRPKHIVVLRESDKVPFFAMLQIVGSQNIIATKCARELVRQFGDINSSIWNTPFADSLLCENGKKGLLEVVDMPYGAPPGQVGNVVAEVYRESIDISWSPPRGDGGHGVDKYGVQIVGQPGYCQCTTETYCSVPKKDIERFLPKGPACWVGRPLAIAAINAKGASVLALAQLTVIDATGWEFGVTHKRNKRLAARAQALDEIAAHNEAALQKVHREKAALRALWELECEGEHRARQMMEHRNKTGDLVDAAEVERERVKAEERRREIAQMTRKVRRRELFDIHSDEDNSNDDDGEPSKTAGATNGTMVIPAYFSRATVPNHRGPRPPRQASYAADVPAPPDQQRSAGTANILLTAPINGRATKHSEVLHPPHRANSCPKSRGASDDNAPKVQEHPQLRHVSNVCFDRSVEAKGISPRPRQSIRPAINSRVVDPNGFSAILVEDAGNVSAVCYDDGSEAKFLSREITSMNAWMKQIMKSGSLDTKQRERVRKDVDVLEPGTRVVDSNGWQCKLKSRHGELGDVSYDDGSTASIPLSALKSIEKHHLAAAIIQRLARRASKLGTCGGT